MADRDHSRSPRGNGANAGTEDIMRLVVQREQARLQKDFSQADSFRDRLGAMGVQMFDKTNSWKAADGRTGRIPTFSEVENGAGSPDAVISMMEDKVQIQPAYSLDSEEGQIKSLVRQREEARSTKDFGRSDQIREELKAMGVEIQDKDKIWKSKSGHCGVVIGYNAGGGSGPSPTDMEISTLVEQREKARSTSDWKMADMIRDELKQWGVDIFDKDKVWRCSDGRNGQVPQWAQPGASSMMGGGPMVPVGYQMQPAVPAHHLNQIIAACVANAQNPATSARTMALLQQAAQPPGYPGQQYGGQHYGTPPPSHRGGGQGYGALPPPPRAQQKSTSGGPSRTNVGSEMKDATKFCKECQASGRPVQDHEIMWLVGVREKMRRDKDYAGADTLRQTFRTCLGLELMEKEKAWSMTDGRRGEIPSWQTLG